MVRSLGGKSDRLLVWYMESSEEVLEEEFKHFTRHLESLPEVELVEWIPAQEEGGFSAFGEPDREAMELAAATGLPSSSQVTVRGGPAGAVQELRIFKSATDREEPGRLMGLASFTLRLDAFIKKTLSGGERDLVMRLWELDGNGAALIAGSSGPAAPSFFQGMKISAVMPLYSVRPIFAFGRTFVAEMLPGPDFLNHHPQRQGMGTLTMGLLISVLAAAAVGGALRRGELLEKKVQSRTAELKESMERLQLADQIFRTTTEGIVITDADGLIQDGNLALERLTGYSLDEIRGKNPDIFGVQKINPDSSPGFWSRLKEAEVWQGEVLNRRKTGEVYPVWLTVSAVKDGEGKVTHFAGVLTYIGDIKAEQERLSHLAYHDPLTGLPNRHLLTDRLEMAIARARRLDALAAAVFIDLDGFKAVNDTWGHETGDLLLVAVAEGLKGAVREQDTVARLGGDEFITVLDGFSSPEEIDVLLSRINGVFSNPFIAGNRPISIRASLGAAIFPDDGTTADQLIAKADELMYARKLKGRGGSR
ncbi:MAG: diguanylate cyclase domain-containing protein [Aminivibrio sp.]|jgi:diguanylate cyclase (GGDEF)-like protein/PAS domain S-box-containing protein